MSSGGSGSTWSWLTTTFTSWLGMDLLPGWSLFAGMLASWATGVTSMVFWWTIGLRLMCWFESMTCWLLAEVLGQVLPRLLPVLQGLPTLGPLTGTWWVQAWLFVNYLTPLQETVVAFAFVSVLVVTFRFLRFGKMFIPTASN